METFDEAHNFHFNAKDQLGNGLSVRQLGSAICNVTLGGF